MSEADKFFNDKSTFKEAARLFRAGTAKAKSGKRDEAFRIFARALILDPLSSKADWLMLSENSSGFEARRDIFRLLSLRIESLREKALNTESLGSVTAHPLVFIYWGQGVDEAPPLVRKCISNAKKVIPKKSLVLLDDANLQDWLDVPAVIIEAKTKSYAAYSDYIRFALLSKYGGVWMDATCFVTADPLTKYEELVSGSGFFAFDKRQQGVISSWFLASRKNDYIAEFNRLSQILYWSVFDDVTTYFFAHQIFRSLYRMDNEFADRWDRRFRYAGNPRTLHRSLTVDVSDSDFRERLSSSFVHKLTYKIESKSLGPSSGYRRFMDEAEIV
jgi:hypothetical protein